MQKYTIFLAHPYSPSEKYNLHVFNKQKYLVSAYSGYVDMGKIIVDGLVRDVYLTSDSSMVIKMSSGEITFVKNLSCIFQNIICESNLLNNLDIIYSVTGNLMLDITSFGSLSVLINFGASILDAKIGTSSNNLSIGRISVISDWSDSTLQNLSSLTLDSMIYLED